MVSCNDYNSDYCKGPVAFSISYMNHTNGTHTVNWPCPLDITIRPTEVLLDSRAALSLLFTKVNEALLQWINTFCKLPSELLLDCLVLLLDGVFAVEFRVKSVDILGGHLGCLQELQHMCRWLMPEIKAVENGFSLSTSHHHESPSLFSYQ